MLTLSSRRIFLKFGSRMLIAGGAGGWLHADVRAQEAYADPDAADAWLRPLLHAPGASAGALHMGRFRDRIYYLDQPIRWSPGIGQKGPTVEVPKGFVTDLASIPRVFWSALPTDGIYTFPAIVHDYMYWNQIHSREIADSIFRQGMADMKVPNAVATTIYTAVRLGGASAWSSNASLKARGERRRLVKFPDDPATTWAEWKKREDCCSDV